MSRLARQVGDRASAQHALRGLTGETGVARVDPWWEFYEHHKDDTDALLKRMWGTADNTR